MHIKDPLLLIGKTSQCNGSSGFPLLLSEWSFTVICLTPYKCDECIGYCHINYDIVISQIFYLFIYLVYSFV